MSNLYVQDNSLKGFRCQPRMLTSFEILCFLEDRREVELTRVGHDNHILFDHRIVADPSFCQFGARPSLRPSDS
jgi:hypothetical protein